MDLRGNRMSAGIANATRPASPGAVSAHGPGTARTATAAVGKADGGSDDGAARPTVSSAMPGLWPTRSTVRHSGRNSRTSISRPSTVASYTRDS
jgi:hypothetical protein